MTQDTQKLYDTNAYGSAFTATIIDIVDGKRLALILDKTLFFPKGGGQVSDKGKIFYNNKQYKVVDVQVNNNIIHHYLEDKTATPSDFEKGDTVEGEIDFEYRFSNMQQHSAEHIFSGLASKHYGCVNVGFHLSDNEVTFDYDKALSEEQIIRLESEVNKVIYENRKIDCYYPNDDELLNLDYRSKKEIEGAVRLVEIDGVDLCACCAPHVRRTGEIGICKVVDFMNYKQGVRISILCGNRALSHYRSLDALTSRISRSLSAKREDIPREIDRLNGTLRDAQYRLIESEKRYLDLIFSNIVQNVETKGLTVTDDAIMLNLNDSDNNVLRNFVNRLKEEYPDKLIVATTGTDKGYYFIIGSVNIDCTKVSDVLREKVGAKGGGSTEMIQGSLDDKLSDNDLEMLCENVRQL